MAADADIRRDRLVLLGTKGGPSLQYANRMLPSSLLQSGGRTCVVDCGLGATRGIVSCGASLKEVDLVFITHLHSDHVLELGAMLHTIWTTGRQKPVKLYGPPGIAELVRHFARSIQFDIDIRQEDEGRPPFHDLVEVFEYSEGLVFDDGMEVAAMRVRHPPVADCFALRFDCAGWRVTFSADTCYLPSLAEFAHRSDILVHEAMLGPAIERIIARIEHATKLRQHLWASHTEAADVGRIAAAAAVDLLLLNHLVPADPDIPDEAWLDAVRTGWDGEVFVGHDGLEVKRQEP